MLLRHYFLQIDIIFKFLEENICLIQDKLDAAVVYWLFILIDIAIQKPQNDVDVVSFYS